MQPVCDARGFQNFSVVAVRTEQSIQRFASPQTCAWLWPEQTLCWQQPMLAPECGWLGALTVLEMDLRERDDVYARPQ
jgi:hypothetical protein